MIYTHPRGSAHRSHWPNINFYTFEHKLYTIDDDELCYCYSLHGEDHADTSARDKTSRYRAHERVDGMWFAIIYSKSLDFHLDTRQDEWIRCCWRASEKQKKKKKKGSSNYLYGWRDNSGKTEQKQYLCDWCVMNPWRNRHTEPFFCRGTAAIRWINPNRINDDKNSEASAEVFGPQWR